MDIITIATTETKARTVKAWFSDKAVWLHTEELQISVNPITLVRACKRLLDNFKATLEIDNDFERRASESIESNITAWFGCGGSGLSDFTINVGSLVDNKDGVVMFDNPQFDDRGDNWVSIKVDTVNSVISAYLVTYKGVDDKDNAILFETPIAVGVIEIDPRISPIDMAKQRRVSSAMFEIFKTKSLAMFCYATEKRRDRLSEQMSEPFKSHYGEIEIQSIVECTHDRLTVAGQLEDGKDICIEIEKQDDGTIMFSLEQMLPSTMEFPNVNDKMELLATYGVGMCGHPLYVIGDPTDKPKVFSIKVYKDSSYLVEYYTTNKHGKDIPCEEIVRRCRPELSEDEENFLKKNI